MMRHKFSHDGVLGKHPLRNVFFESISSESNETMEYELEIIKLMQYNCTSRMIYSVNIFFDLFWGLSGSHFVSICDFGKIAENPYHNTKSHLKKLK